MTGTDQRDSLISMVASRRSHKQPFLDQAVDAALVRDCIALATRAPSAHNAQPWRFMSFFRGQDPDDEMRARILDAMTSRFVVDLERDGRDPAAAATMARASRDRFVAAPVLVVAFMDALVLDEYPDTTRQDAERVMGVQGVAAAITTLLLAFHASGLGACWYCAPLFAGDVFHDVLRVPPSWKAQAFITAGHRPGGAGTMPAVTRRPVDEILLAPGAFLDGTGNGGAGQ